TEGNEIHVRHFPELAGRRLRALYDAFPKAIPLGTVRSGVAPPHLNPPEDHVLDAEDRIVFLATTHEDCEPLRTRLSETPARDGHACPPSPSPDRRRVLVLGWSPRVSALIAEFGRYDAEAFDIDIVSVTDAGTRESHLAHFEVPAGKVNVKHIEGDYTVPLEMRKLDPARYDSVVLVSSQWTGAEEEADARTILAYLLLQEVLPVGGVRPAILAEIMDAENLALFTRASCETLQPTVILSHMLSQVVLRRELGGVFDELFGPGGAEIVYRSAADYGLSGRSIRFPEVLAAAARQGETALGFHFETMANPETGALLNPPRDAVYRLGPGDDVVVLTTYSTHSPS
ncbi:MAG: CASTOR/POLLUX-related putative ion channel, partial [Myxococcota bacterium]